MTNEIRPRGRPRSAFAEIVNDMVNSTGTDENVPLRVPLPAEEEEISDYLAIARGDTTRKPMREEMPLARANRKTLELRQQRGDSLNEEAADKFGFPLDEVPNGWTYQWKRETLLGLEDPSYSVNLARDGWEAVPASRHPWMMPKNIKCNVIRRDGMLLMEKPTELVRESQEHELRKARLQVRQKEAQLGDAPQGTMQRDNKGNSLTKIGKSYEAIAIP